jgi:hypothetical protein
MIRVIPRRARQTKNVAVAMASAGPPVTRDPRFKAGRSLIQSGRANEGAVDIFATLLEVRSRNEGWNVRVRRISVTMALT